MTMIEHGMDTLVAGWIWLGVAAYLGIGALLLIWLFAGGLARLDAQAQSAPLRAKLLIAPGLIALWPLILRRLSGARAPEDLQ